MKIFYTIVYLALTFLMLPQKALAQQGFGNHVWNVNCYSDQSFNTFAGYYVDSNSDFDTRNFWGINSSPSSAAGYIGAPIGDNQHSYVAKKQGFVPGCYEINILAHDDETWLLIDGVQVFAHSDGCCDQHIVAWAGTLDENSTVEIRTTEGVGGSVTDYQISLLGPAYVDADGDGYGNPSLPTANMCILSPGYVRNNYDCDDSSNAIVPPSCQNNAPVIDCQCVCPKGFGGANCENNLYCSPTYWVAGGYNQIGDLSIVGTTLTNHSGPNSGYVFYNTQPFHTATLQIGNTYTVSATVNGNSQDIFVWIDGNDDYIFDNSEMLGYSYNTSNFGTSNFPIFINCTATPGVHRMRVSCVIYGGQPIASCGSFNYGETEDYNITIAAGCPKPLDLAASVVNATNATLNWTPACSETQFEVAVQNLGSGIPTGNGVVVSGNSYQATGLIESYAYEFYVRSNCGSGNYSSWSGPYNFTTPLAERDFGDNVWNVNCYLNQFGTFYGYYADSAMNFNTESTWNVNGNPSDAPGYTGQPLPADFHSYNAKRRGFTPGCYQVILRGHDDACAVKINGITVYDNQNASGSANATIFSGSLDADSTIEIHTKEYTGGSQTFLEIVPLALVPVFADSDNDGYGDVSQSSMTCVVASAGYSLNDDDCDDTNPTLNAAPVCQNSGVTQGCGCQCQYGFSGDQCQTNNYCIPSWSYYGTNVISGLSIVGTTLSNTSTSYDWSSYGYSFYSEYTGALQASSSYMVSFNISEGVIGIVAWIDANDDLVFTDDERVGKYGNPGDALLTAGAHQVPITLPCTMTPGFHRMRFRTAWQYADGISSCGTLYLGETEDYNITVTPGPCLAPQALTALSITTTGATLSWSSNCVATPTEVVVQPAGSGVPTGNGISAGATSYQATNLTEDTSYEYYVRTVCQPGVSYSTWAGPFTFATPVVPKDFGNGVWNVNCYGDSNFSAFKGYYVDTNSNFNSSLLWDGSTTPSNAPGYHGAPVAVDNHSYIAKRRGFTPGCYQINVLEHDDYTRLFVNGQEVFAHYGCCDPHPNVWRGTLDANSTVEIWLYEFTGNSVANYEIAPASLILVYADVDGDGNGGVAASPVQACTATLGYSANNQDCDDNNPTYSTPNCQNGGVANGCACECAFGFGGIDCSTNLYCVPQIASPDYNSSLLSVSFGNFFHQTNNNHGFAYYSGPTGTFNPGQSYTMYIDAFIATGKAVWIDFNDNLIYEAGERIGYGTGHYDPVTITIPCTATPGNHRMRVMNIPDVQGIDLTPCGSYATGEAEEYTITILTPNPCSIPTSLLASNLTYNGATFTWTSLCGTPQYEYIVQTFSVPVPTASSVGTLITTNSVTITGLQEFTNYRFFVRKVCDGGLKSTWVLRNFTTPGNILDYGNGVWNVNCYGDTGTHPAYFSGSYVDTNLNFNTENYWLQDSSPSSAPGYSGHSIYEDYHAYNAKRRGFTPGCYRINILAHDDDTQLYVNGEEVFNHYGCCDTHENAWSGTLDANSTLDIITVDFEGGSISNYEIVYLGPSVSYYADNDSDGYGNPVGTPVVGCSAPIGYVANNTDCNDQKPLVYPGAVEIGYNLIDDDCDGLTDEGFPPKATAISGLQCNTVLPAIDSQVFADIVAGAQGYQWRITTMSGSNTGQVQLLNTSLRVMKLTQLATYAYNTTYKVEVAVYFAGFLQPYTASTCTVSSPELLTKLTNCGQTINSTSEIIYANIAPFATGYKFRITDPLAPLNTQEIVRTVREFRMNLITAFAVQYGKSYNVEVAIRNTNGVYMNYGTTCSVNTPQFPTTSIQDTQCDGYTPPTLATPIYAISYSGAIAYVFNLSGNNFGSAGVEITKSTRTFKLSDFTGLIAGATYNLKVRLVFNLSDVSGVYGKTCTVTVPGALRMAQLPFDAKAYPNPFADNFTLDVITSTHEKITVRIYDMTGRLLENRDVKTSEVKSLTIGDKFPSGVYNVIVSQGEEIKTLRVVKR